MSNKDEDLTTGQKVFMFGMYLAVVGFVAFAAVYTAH